jgi:hypothetical protein
LPPPPHAARKVNAAAPIHARTCFISHPHCLGSVERIGALATDDCHEN